MRVGKPMRWGVLGAARIAASALIPALRANGSEVVAIGCADAERGRAFARTHGIAHATGYEALMARDDIDAIYVALANSGHLPWTLAALSAGKHVLCEKPLALNAAEVDRIRAASLQHGRLVMEAFMYRFHPQVDRLRALVSEGALGHLRWLRGDFSYVLGDPSDVRWNPALGGGALYDLGCYPLNLMRLVAQAEPEVLSVAARLTNPWPDGGRVDHAAHAVVQFDTVTGPVLGHLDCAFSLPLHSRFEALCQHGVLRLDVPFTSKGVATSLYIGERVEQFPACDPYALMATHFEAAVRGEVGLRFTLDDSLAQARALDAMLVRAHGA